MKQEKLEKQYWVVKLLAHGSKQRGEAAPRLPCPLTPLLGHQLNWRFKQYLPGSAKMKAGLPRMRWDSKEHYLQRFLCNCVLFSPIRRQNLRNPCRFLLRTLIFSLQEALHTKIRFGHVGLHVMIQMKSDFVAVWYLHQVLHPQEPVLDSFLITWMVNYRVGLSELSTMSFYFFSIFTLSIYRFFWE